jgi:hypothetical protein
MHKRQMLVDVNPRLVSIAVATFLQFTISIYITDIFGRFLLHINTILDILSEDSPYRIIVYYRPLPPSDYRITEIHSFK